MKKTKKWVAILTLTCLLLSSNAVFASDTITEDTTGAQKMVQREKGQVTVGEKVQDRVQFTRMWMQELKPYFEQIRKNNGEIIKLRNELAQTRNQVGQTIKELREQKETLTEEQIQELKGYLEVIKANKTEIKNELGNIHREVVKLRIAKREGQLDNAKTILQGIIDTQQDRMELLQTTIDDLNQITEV